MLAPQLWLVVSLWPGVQASARGWQLGPPDEAHVPWIRLPLADELELRFVFEDIGLWIGPKGDPVRIQHALVAERSAGDKPACKLGELPLATQSELLATLTELQA